MTSKLNRCSSGVRATKWRILAGTKRQRSSPFKSPDSSERLTDMRTKSRENSFKPNVKKYKYTPLGSLGDSIRLLRIAPAEIEGSIIRCELFHTKLSEAPTYTALSYTWGDQSSSKQIVIGIENVSITQNLWQALGRLRPVSGDPLVIWIDAICINQDDITERSIQTSKMRIIYQNADGVAIWLGADFKGSASAIQLARDLNMCSSPEQVSAIIQNPACAEDLESLVLLFRRQYWWRIWVIQEVYVAKKATVYCGADSIPWNQLDHICDISRTEESYLLDLFYHRPSFVHTLTHGGPRGLQPSRFSPHLDSPPLLELLLSHKSKKSTDPKDKVFALVGISDTRDTFGSLDYSRSIREIFTHTARHIISSTGKLDVICVRQHDRSPANLPSWVPAWSRPPQNFGSIPIGLHHHVPKFTAAGNSTANFEFLQNGYALKVTGFKIDTITFAGMAFRQKGAPKNVEPALHIFHDWWNLFSSSIPDPESLSSQAIFCRAISCGNWMFDESEPTYSEKLSSIFGLSSTLLSEDDDPDIETPYQSLSGSIAASLADDAIDIDAQNEDDIADKGQLSVVINASTMMNRRRLFISSGGLVGLAPWDAVVGDFIAILLGCSYPVVLREAKGGWNLVGEVFVNGYMYGEAMAGLNEGRYMRESFEIF